MQEKRWEGCGSVSRNKFSLWLSILRFSYEQIIVRLRLPTYLRSRNGKGAISIGVISMDGGGSGMA